MSEELKPCPFCGDDPSIGGSDTIGFWVSCGNCFLWMGYFENCGSNYGDFESIDAAHAAWNSRCPAKS